MADHLGRIGRDREQPGSLLGHAHAKLDRLSRSRKDVLHIMERIGNVGAGGRSIIENIETTTPAGRMMMQMIGASAEFERTVIRERTVLARRKELAVEVRSVAELIPLVGREIRMGRKYRMRDTSPGGALLTEGAPSVARPSRRGGAPPVVIHG